MQQSSASRRPTDNHNKYPPCRAEKRARLQAKKEERKPLLSLVKQAVKLWEAMRPRDKSPAATAAAASELVAVGKGHMKELSMNHASSRAVQALLKHGGAAARSQVWAECKDAVPEMAMSPHGSHVIRKLVATASPAERSGAPSPAAQSAQECASMDKALQSPQTWIAAAPLPRHCACGGETRIHMLKCGEACLRVMQPCRAAMLRAVKGNVVKLFRHPCSSPVLSDLYDDLPPAERNALIAEFYARDFALLGGALSAAGRLDDLVAAWPTLDGARRRGMLQHLLSALSPIIEKGYVDPSAIHRCAPVPWTAGVATGTGAK